jgi:serine/threonine protein kinase
MNTSTPSVETILAEAVEIVAPVERQAFVERACGGDSALQSQVERLIAHHFEAGSFLERPAAVDPRVIAAGEMPSLSDGPGAVIGPYKLLEQIGEGGMGMVYLAEQTRPVRRKVALKIIKPGMDTKQVVARFDAERQALAMMDHPNIARVHDGGTTESGRPYFVMEPVRGIAITAYCDREQLTICDRLELFVLVCRAVQHAHQKGIIHRDLKPSNILVTVIDGAAVPKVIDFGVAKATSGSLTDKTLFTGFHQFIGTPLYMSPEQADLSGMDVDTRSDIYSLGVLLYELLTGTTPFDQDTFRTAAFDEMRRMIREDVPPKPSTRISSLGEALPTLSAGRKLEPKRLEGELKGELDWIVMKALEKDRRRRYETASDFATDVMRYLTDRPVEACPPSAWYRFSKYARRNRMALTTAGVVSFALVGGAAASAWQAIRATQAEQRATGQASRALRAEAYARVEAENAKRSAAESEAVRKFLENTLLATARPEAEYGGLGKDATIRQALDSARARISEAFKGQPLIEAAVRTTLGVTYLQLGENLSAVEQLKPAVELRRMHLGPDHVETLSSCDYLADAYQEAGQIADAIGLHKSTLLLQEATLGRDHPDATTSRDKLARAYIAAGDPAKAINLLEAALERLDPTLRPDHPDRLNIRNDLARAYIDAGRTTEAITILEDTLRLREAKLGKSHTSTLASRNYLANAYRDAGRSDEAIAIHEETLKARESKFGSDHPRTLMSRNNLADAYCAAGRTAEAVKLHEETRAAREKKLGPDHPDTLRSVNDLASSYLEDRRFADAIKLLEAVRALQDAKLGPDHPHTLTSRDNLARAYLAAQRWADAERTARACLALRDKKQPDDGSRVRTLSHLGAALAGQGKYAEAEPLLLESYEVLKARAGTIRAPRKVSWPSAGAQVVKLYEAWGKVDQAAEWRRRLGAATTR